jgi:hypothetical protein
MLQCECGRTATKIREVGFTANHHLVLHWRCSGCRKFMYVVKPLADCWRDCPAGDGDGSNFPFTEETIQESDITFLRRMGVRFPDGEAQL